MPYKDPEQQKEAKRQWYLRNKKLTIERSMAYKHREQEWFKSVKSARNAIITIMLNMVILVKQEIQRQGDL